MAAVDRWLVAASLGLLAAWGACDFAQAQSTIKRPGARTKYTAELEPHLVFGAYGPAGTDDGFGLGLRGTFELAEDGFIPKLNDSVGLGVGLDWLRYDGWVRGECTRFQTGPNNTRICTEVDGGDGSVDALLVPVVMQWNFWLHRRWSVFGEPGLFMVFHNDEFDIHPVSIAAGGRWHFSERATLTLRLGYPTLTLGVSFLL